MRRLTTYEHTWLSIGPEGDLRQQDAQTLAQMEAYLPKRCLDWGRHRVKFRQFCGLVQLGQVQIEILPKIYQQQQPAQERRDLLEILAICGEFKALPALQAELATGTQGLLDIFIWHFIYLLEHELQQGLLRDYRQTQATLGQVRGRIDLVRQQRENRLQPQRLACRFYELVTDIPVNRLLHTSLLYLIDLVTVPELRQRLCRLRQRFIGITCLPPRAKLVHPRELNRMQRRYADVVSLARLFLQGRYLDIRAGEQPAFSLLFDMERLFERYAKEVVKPVVSQLGGYLFTQGPRRYLAKDTMGKHRVHMRPDICIENQDQQLLTVMDVKWKILSGTDPLSCLATNDLYQISVYAQVYGCSQVFLLYPQQATLTTSRQLQIVTGVTLHLMFVPLQKEKRTQWQNDLLTLLDFRQPID
ncbi:5-methylcytosine-specific restriction enzyme subunit McrC [Allopseudospirillum japonicum]|uniref:5-methylcytosine-specific restriction enzyme subunit McrC n=1 Tax=Allopseudospirillum japonicum TaxID=64971 RepID=A0A1H6QE64_9GAMM|nr:hypothetical protein [Allopseudospirillum japonicum]SEI38517.1 5-methylcytosine-specific restriction enzyme subunit McrC [Allopseudospirillum japonicum]